MGRFDRKVVFVTGAARHQGRSHVVGFARELAPDSTRVNAILPTGVDTPMIHNAHTYEVLPGRDPAAITKADIAPVFRGLNLLPGPWVDPQDVTNAVLFLASDEARFLTGVQLPVDAGFTMS